MYFSTLEFSDASGNTHTERVTAKTDTGVFIRSLKVARHLTAIGYTLTSYTPIEPTGNNVVPFVRRTA